MQAGRLSERITLQAKSVTRDAMGAEVITWQDQATVWAAAEPLRGREYVALRAAQSDLTVRFRIRYLATVKPEWRAVWRSDRYEIAEVINPRARNVELELMCRSAVNG